MKDDSSSNVASSGTMSPNEPARHGNRHSSDDSLSEPDYLTRQAADAKAAMSRTIEELQQSLKDSADLRYWARQHPWAAVGAALAGGFVAATVLIPRKPDQRDEVGHRDEFEVLDGQRPAVTDRDDAKAPRDEQHGRSKSSRILAALASPLFDMLKALIDNALMALVSSGVASQSAADESDAEEADEAAAGVTDTDARDAY